VDFDLDLIKAFFGFNWFCEPIKVMVEAELPCAAVFDGLDEIVERIEKETGVAFVFAAQT